MDWASKSMKCRGWARRIRQCCARVWPITIEPGVYIEGVGGIRIEDTVLVTATGCEILTPTSKEFVSL